MSQEYKEELIQKVLFEMGEDPDREGLLDTPKRVVKSWKELYSGYDKDPKQILSTTFASEKYDQMILLKDIEFFSQCEHHCLPFFGKAHVAYVPKKRVVGLSKLARIVDCFSRRLQIQERMTKEIAESIFENLDARGVAVVVEAKHMCMMLRGVQKQNSVMTTSHLIGTFKKDSICRAEFLRLIGKQ